jgi:hypothetical protein
LDVVQRGFLTLKQARLQSICTAALKKPEAVTAPLSIKPKPAQVKMTQTKTYLTVPYAQKDKAKTLGAKWDAVAKKWYVPAGRDIALFAQWRTQTTALESPQVTRASSAKAAAPAHNAGVFTLAADKDFVAYNGDEPPWN